MAPTGAAGYDLSSAKDVVVPAHGKAIAPTDLSIKVPEGMLLAMCLQRCATQLATPLGHLLGTYGRIAPRSGLAWKKFIDIGAGTRLALALVYLIAVLVLAAFGGAL
jgi:dUTP pyrophosphatase